ncbi:hypothetical protein ACFQX7_10815 [Luedemannella flava]
MRIFASSAATTALIVPLQGAQERVLQRRLVGHELLDRGVGEQSAARDDDQMIGEQGRLAHEVTGDEHRAPFVRQVAQERAQPADALRVEAVERFVEQ